MYRNILVAVDGSHTSDLALRQAITLAREQESALRIVHVVDEVTASWESAHDIYSDLREHFRKSGYAVLEEARQLAGDAGVSVDSRLLEIDIIGRRIADMIIEEARRWRADLIVVGSHGRRGVAHLVLGSVAEGVARAADVPVLLVHGK